MALRLLRRETQEVGGKEVRGGVGGVWGESCME